MAPRSAWRAAWGLDDRTIEVAGVVEERQEQVEEQLAVRLAPHVAVEEQRELLGQPAAQPAERLDRAGAGEEPLPVAEGVGVLGARRADGREPHVRDERVGADVAEQVGQADLRAVVDRPALEEDLAGLVEADAPARRDVRLAPHRERAPLELDDPRAEIWTVTDEADESSHTPLLLRRRPGRGKATLLSSCFGTARRQARNRARGHLVTTARGSACGAPPPLPHRVETANFLTRAAKFSGRRSAACGARRAGNAPGRQARAGEPARIPASAREGMGRGGGSLISPRGKP